MINEASGDFRTPQKDSSGAALANCPPIQAFCRGLLRTAGALVAVSSIGCASAPSQTPVQRAITPEAAAIAAYRASMVTIELPALNLNDVEDIAILMHRRRAESMDLPVPQSTEAPGAAAQPDALRSKISIENRAGQRLTLLIPTDFYTSSEIKKVPRALVSRKVSHAVLAEFSDQYFNQNKEVLGVIAQHLTTQSDTREAKAQSILDWVRGNIKYQSDQVTYGHEEFWASPLESLVGGAGDCEDATFLFAALCKAADLECKVAFVWNRKLDRGHALALVAGDFSGDGFRIDKRDYYFAEATPSAAGQKIGSPVMSHFRQDSEWVSH